MHTDWAALQRQYRDALYESVIPFWEKHSPDEEYKGFFTCLDRDGTVFDTDKFMWLQARAVWMFSHLYNRVEKRQSWLDLASQGAQFITTHGMDDKGQFYFSLLRDGTPMTAPYNIYADCFSAMAFAEYSKASGSAAYLDAARQVYRSIQARKDRPKGIYTKQMPGARPIRALGFGMIQINMARVFKEFDHDQEYDRIITQTIDDMLTYHLSENDQVLYERTAPDGSHPFCMEARLLCPGHACEVIWFTAKVAQERGDKKLINTLCQALLWTLRRGWDQEYGGIMYYQDVQGFPTDKLESEMKLWWVHAEALYAALYLFRLTGDQECLTWFHKIHDWSWERFHDQEFGEWFGYLYRDGTVAKTLKGGKWKGFFHLPRVLLECIDTLAEIADGQVGSL